MVDQSMPASRGPASPKPPDDARQQQLREAIELFFFGYRAFTAQPDRILQRRGLGRVHHRILYFVGREPQLPMHRLLATLGVSKQALNGPLRHLVDAGLVRVTVADHDRRLRLLRLSAEGERLEAQLTGTQMTQLAGVFARAGSQAEAGWRMLMRDLADTGAE